VIGKTQSLQSVVEGIPDIIARFLRDDFTYVSMSIAGDTSQDTGANHNSCRQDKETALPRVNHSINGLTEHPWYSQAKGGGGYQAYKGKEQPLPVFLGEPR
jgi:hypothetical protein